MGDAAREPNTLPRLQPNAAYRQREYLTEKEVDRLIEAARKRGRNGARDAAAILPAYRHGRWRKGGLRNSGKTDAKRASQTARMPGHSLALHHDQTKWAQSDHG